MIIDLKKQIESIIEDLVNDASISSILLKAQAIAFYLKDEAFSNWIKSEQNGYSNIDELPEYRKAKCAIKIDVSIPFRGIIFDLDFPIDVISNKMIRDDLSHIYFCEPISVIEQMGNHLSSNLLKVNASAYTYKYINQNYPDGNIEGVRKITNTSSAKTIIDSVKSKLLDFFLKFEDQIDLNVDFNVMASNDKIQTIMNQTIKAGIVNTGTGNISISKSEIIGGNENVTISTSDKKSLESIVSEIENANAGYNNEDISYEIEEIKNELQKNQQNPRLIKRAFNTIKGIACGIAANELTCLVDKGLDLFSIIF